MGREEELVMKNKKQKQMKCGECDNFNSIATLCKVWNLMSRDERESAAQDFICERETIKFVEAKAW